MSFTITSDITVINYNNNDTIELIRKITKTLDNKYFLPIDFYEKKQKKKNKEGWFLEINDGRIHCVETDGPISIPFDKFAKTLGKTIMVRRSGHIHNYSDEYITLDIFYIDSNGSKFNDITRRYKFLTKETKTTFHYTE